ncbi:tol-pal system YbgF family protein [Streptomyces sp. NPDC101115]|uniref:tol-pal system YbgF family protein n=1 Tax=Streptomyces sp. NPDC101115 TaxID=3366106 RepID=UPI003801C952
MPQQPQAAQAPEVPQLPPPPPAHAPVYDAVPPPGTPTAAFGPAAGAAPGPAFGAVPAAAPPPPPQPWPNAVAAGLLNLSCLGLGYVLLRQWIGAVVCWAATVALLVTALPADPDGIPAGALVAYGVFLVLAALDAARRARRTPLASWASARQGLVVPLALVLFAVPVGGGLAYGAARDEAKEQLLLDQLAAADKQVKDGEGQAFTSAEAGYRSALDTYQRIGTKHSGSRAAKLVPDRLQTYYASVSAAYGKKDYCKAVPALKHLRDLPRTVDRALLGTVVGRADEPLAESWFECGTGTAGNAGQETSSAEHLNALLTTFPQSPFAQKVEPTLREALRTRDKSLGVAPCATAEDLRRFDTTVDALPGAAFASLGKDVGRSIQRGDFACGIDQFKKKEYSEAISTMNDYVKAYPDSPQTAQARNVAIAAEIAEETPAAGNKVPSGATSDGSGMVMVVSNDGPGEVELLYTGPVTGRITLPACGGCKAYPGILPVGGKVKACSGPSSKYPKRTLTLPPGNYQMLQKRDSTRTSAEVKKGSTAKIESGYTYTNCLYVTSLFS